MADKKLAEKIEGMAAQVTTKDLLLKAQAGLTRLIEEHQKLKAHNHKLTDRINSLYTKLAHGDAEHKEWLRKTIEEHFNAP